ncbi:MAG: hypothetical protein ACXWTK_03365 [Methylobacter sp.]
MSLPLLTFTILAVLALSVGQILFKTVASNFDFSATDFVGSLFNIKLVIALIGYFFAMIMWLFCGTDTCPFPAGRKNKLEHLRRSRPDSGRGIRLSVRQGLWLTEFRGVYQLLQKRV